MSSRKGIWEHPWRGRVHSGKIQEAGCVFQLENSSGHAVVLPGAIQVDDGQVYFRGRQGPTETTSMGMAWSGHHKKLAWEVA